MSHVHRLPIKLDVQGPFLSQDVSAAGFGIDAALMRRDDESVVLPGTQVKGLLRQVFSRALALNAPGVTQDWIDTWFGAESGTVASALPFDPLRGKVKFSDFVAVPDVDRCEHAITRVQIDEERGSVAEGMLQVLEAPWTYGDRIAFEGEAIVLGPTGADELALLHSRLDWAFRLIPAVGAFKTAGFGRLLDARMDADWIAPPPLATADAAAIQAAGGAAFDLRPQEGFVVDARSFGGNYFSGAAIIPGQVLKAMAARWLDDHGLLAGKGDLLAAIVFQHGHPVPDGTPLPPRPLTRPLSLYSWMEGENYTVADCLERFADFNEFSQLEALAFAPDWKPAPPSVESAYPMHEPPRRVRTRTAISEAGTAEDERLFSHAAVESAGFVWRGRALIPPGTDTATAAEMAALLSALNGKVHGLGKTKAAVEWQASPLARQPVATARRDGSWRITLQTPACLHGPHASRPASNDPAADLRAVYAGYWQHVLADPSIAVEFVARQRLAGGYLAQRYPVSAASFEPYVLTEAGSVFVLTGSDDIRKRLERLAIAGLPLGPGWPAVQQHWRHHPFLPEAGWGEVHISGENPLDPEHNR